MGNVKDITGMRFNMWTVLEFSHMNKSGAAMFKCRCDCGTEKIVNGYTLRRGASKSCGCYRPPVSGHTRHDERLYGVWCGIRDRCNNPKSKYYSRYGGRGIKLCKEWNDYEEFKKWAYENGYDDQAKKYECTIDRINNDGDYEPDNCEWHNQKQQCNNKSDNHIIEYNGESHTLKEWSEITGINKSTIWRRITKYGWSVDRALTEQSAHESRNRNALYDLDGESHTLSEWASIKGMRLDTLCRRINHYHWSIEKALTTEVAKRAS